MLSLALLALIASDSTPAPRAPKPYSLLNPVPYEFLRDLATDRPDVTESPYTVDVGHIQLEMDAVNFTDARLGGIGAQYFGIGALNAKIGLRSNVDLQIVTQFYTSARDRDDLLATTTSTSGPSDVTARLKINLWGDDEGKTAFALMPFVTVPTHGTGFDVGLIAPLGIDLGRGWGMGLMSEVDVLRRESGVGHHVNILHSATVSHDVVGPIGAYGELVAEIVTDGPTVLSPTFDAGLTFGFAPNLQFDLGANVGLNHHADRITAFFGISRRY